MKTDDIRDAVRGAYGAIAAQPAAAPCAPLSNSLGYTQAELDLLPEGADLGLGCGNPQALAGIAQGERVLDLGCGAGIDVLLAAKQVGPEGRAIGVDMTPEMLARARKNVVDADLADRIDIREGHIEALPVRDGEVDVVISNCVINLSPDTSAVFREAFRALAPGGRLAVSDILLTQPLPEEVATSITAWVGCLAGAHIAEDYLAALQEAGFVDIETSRKPVAGLLEMGEANLGLSLGLSESVKADIAETVFSYSIRARKPADA